MYRVNLSMVLLLCLAVIAFFYLIGTQQNLTPARAMIEQASNTPTRNTYFVTVTPSATLSVFTTATPVSDEAIIYADRLPGVELREVNRDVVPMAGTPPTATRTPTPINVGDSVWDDIDNDGIHDGSEPGLANVVVQLWTSDKSQMLNQTTTDSSGHYTLVASGPGNYRVRAFLPNGDDAFSPKNAGGDDLLDSDINPSGANLGFTDIYVFAANLISISSIDIGILKFRTPTPTRTPTPINVGNLVWNDLDGDGRQDAGESGIEGVTVQLWDSAKTTMFDETVTNASGIYTLIAPLPGNYRVRVIKPSSADDFSPKNQAGGDDQLDSDVNPTGDDAGYTDVYNFASNLISITTIDIGMIPATPIAIGNRLWLDVDGDGIQEAREPGIAHRAMQLRRHFLSTSLLVTSTYTNSTGGYVLVAPDSGTYFICVVEFDDEALSPKDADDHNIQTVNDVIDSDVNNTVTGNGKGCTNDYAVTANLTNIDAGIVTARASVVGQVTLEGHGSTPSVQWSVPVHVIIVPAGGGTAVFDSTVLIDTSGVFLIGGIPTGDYTIWVKQDHTLAVLVNTTLDMGNNTLDFGTLREGDASNDNQVNITDFSLLAAAFGKLEGQAGYDPQADLNNDGAVNIADFSLLAANFGQVGEAAQ